MKENIIIQVPIDADELRYQQMRQRSEGEEVGIWGISENHPLRGCEGIITEVRIWAQKCNYYNHATHKYAYADVEDAPSQVRVSYEVLITSMPNWKESQTTIEEPRSVWLFPADTCDVKYVREWRSQRELRLSKGGQQSMF